MSSTNIKKELINYLSTNVFIDYLNIPEYKIQEIEDSEFSSILKSISLKIDILLKLPHQEFWCHIIFDKSVLRSLQSYFNNASRPYELMLNGITWHQLEKELHKKYYLLILRIISNKEANIPEFNNINFGALIYDNFIIDIPFLFDLCSLYGESNSEIISKMILFVFSCQPLYLNDLEEYSKLTIKLLDENISKFITNDLKTSKERCDFHSNNNYHSTEEKSIEILHYIIDLCYSWNVMLNAVKTKPELFQILFNISFHKTIEKLFQKFVPIMHSTIDKFEISDPDKLKQLLSVCCFFMISVWRQIFSGKCLNKFNENGQSVTVRSSEENFELINECLTVIHSCQEYSIFADAMYLMFPIQDDFDLIFHAVISDKDQFYLEFVNEAIKETVKDINDRHTMFSSQSSITDQLSSFSIDRDPETARSDFTQIMEIFPMLKETEIKAYIELYNCNPADLLESLVSDVISTDSIKAIAMTIRNDCGNRKPFDYQSVLSNHRNIYDGDQLETGQVQRSQLHIGKRQTDLNPNVDPNLREMIMNIVQKQNEEEDERVDIIPLNGNLNYNDEFDDVYGISHDGIIYNKKEDLEEAKHENIKITKAYRMKNKANETSSNENRVESIASKKGATAAVAETNTVGNGTIMEPSKLKHSVHDQRQFKKKRFQDGPSRAADGVNNGYTNHRLGSHAPKESNFVKRDHRSKAEKNRFNES